MSILWGRQTPFEREVRCSRGASQYAYGKHLPDSINREQWVPVRWQLVASLTSGQRGDRSAVLCALRHLAEQGNSLPGEITRTVRYWCCQLSSPAHRMVVSARDVV